MPRKSLLKSIKKYISGADTPKLAGLNAIPGMIEPIEQKLLFELAKSITLKKDEKIVEFGSFFGKSSRCIIDGIIQSNSELNGRSVSALAVFDSFSCAVDGPFAPHAKEFADKGGVTHLLSESDGILSFVEIFKHYSKDVDKNTLSINQCELMDMIHDHSTIRLIHFDLPKWYEEYRTLLNRFAPKLANGSYIVYQDFFYHWSATLIAAVYIWIESGLITPISTAASTLAVKTNRAITDADIAELDLVMTQRNEEDIIDSAIHYFEQFEVDRKEIFVGRLHLANMQHCFEKRNYKKSAEIMAGLISSNALSSSILANDFKELIYYGFSMRTLYQLDH